MRLPFRLRFPFGFSKWLFSLFLAPQLAQLSAGQCSDGYEPVSYVCVIAYNTSVSWQNAADICAGDNATLFNVKRQTDWDQILDNVIQEQMTSVWVALHYDNTTGMYTWSDGTPYDPLVDWAPWGFNQPNPNTGQCVSTKYDAILQKLAWFMVSCSDALLPVCVRPQDPPAATGPESLAPTFSDVTCPPGFVDFAGECVMYNQVPADHETAMANCIVNNSHVFFISQDALWEYATFFPPVRDTIWIGLSYNTTTQEFTWADGNIFNNGTDWAAWCPDQPGTPGQWIGNCVNAMFDSSGSLDAYCWYVADCAAATNSICVLNSPSTSCKQAYSGNFSPLLANGYLSYPALKSVQNASVSTCALACMRSAQCASFDWNTQTRTCYLLEQQFTDDCVSFLPGEEYRHYDFIRLDQACYC